jgi:hypothetical protein
MKNWMRFIIFAVLLAALVFPGAALAKGVRPDRLVPGGNFTLKSGETQEGTLFVLGGNVVLQVDSTVTGDVLLLGGNLQSSGIVQGSIVSLGGLVRLESQAVVARDVVMIGSQLSRAAGARVEGDVIDRIEGQFSQYFPGGVELPRFDVGFPPFINVLGFLFKLFLWTALAVLVALFLPAHTQRVTHTAIRQPLIAGGLGLLTVVVLPPMLLLLTVTILLIPLSLALAAVAALAWCYGLVALGLEVGRRLAEVLKQEWAPAVSAAAGTFVLILVINGARELIPCVGWIVPAVVGMLGLGAVVLTRFGMQAYPMPFVPLAPVIVPEPAPPAPPQTGPDPLSMMPEEPPVPSTPLIEPEPAPEESESGDAGGGYVDQG